MRILAKRSMTFRLTLLFAVVSAFVFLALGLLIRDSVERHFEELDMHVLSDHLTAARLALEQLHAPSELDALARRLDDRLGGTSGLALKIVLPAGTTFAVGAAVEFPREFFDGPGSNEAPQSPQRWMIAGQPWRGVVMPVHTAMKDAPPVRVAVAISTSHHEQFMVSFRSTLWTFVMIAASLTGILGWLAVRHGLAPLQEIRQQAAGITAQRLDSRLPVESVPLELSDLVGTLNEMLARLEDSFRRLSDFSSDLAHELRTPVSNLLTQTQVALSKSRTLADYHEILVSNAEEFEHLARMIGDILFLAKSENGLIVPRAEGFEIADELGSLIEYYALPADEKRVVLTSTATGRVFGDRSMLRRAIGNLLSNAVRHTPVGGWITVSAGHVGKSRWVLRVENSGETIPAEHVVRLFDRFYRADASRQHLGDGVGLGLAITRSIVRAHGGDVAVRSVAGLTRFDLVLPRSRADVVSWSVDAGQLSGQVSRVRGLLPVSGAGESEDTSA